LPAYFRDAVDRFPDEPLFRRADGGVLTYAAACRRSVALADRLVELGIGPGSFVVSYLDDTVETALFDLACTVADAVPAPLSPVFSPAYLCGMCRRLDTRWVLTRPDLAPTVADAGLSPLVLGSGYPTHVYALPDAGDGPPDAAERVADAARRTCPDALFLVQPTSGSTGVPKLVARPHRAFARYATFVGAELAELPDRPRVLAAAALTHAFGMHLLVTAIALGAELDVPGALDTAASIHEVRDLDPTVLPTTPRVLRSLVRQARDLDGPAHPVFGPSARVVLSAGGRADPDLLRGLQRDGIDVVEWYGSSEASLVALTPRGGWRPGFTGRVVPDTRVRVADDGELLVRSPGLMVGYHGDAPTTAAAYTDDGFYRTGDLGEVTPDGWLRVCGRKRDVFNTPEGSNVYPERIEAMIEAFPEVDQAMLVGDQRPYLAAFVVAGADAGVDADRPALHTRIENRLAALNRRLEPVERIQRVIVLSRPFPAEAYAVVGAGKAHRDRVVFRAAYASQIDELYEETP
jgi:long-chain acyl-CoA synthetase